MTSATTVLITGCSSGIGLSTALALKKRGYRVFATARKAADIQHLQNRGLESLELDLNDSASIRNAVNEVLKRTGGTLDALINNAGYGQPGAIEDLSREVLRAQFETNVFGLQELITLIVPVMRQQKHGRIINISSILGLVSMAYRGAYCASKFALEGLTDALRLELYGTGIRVSLIEPGPIDSKFRETARKSYEQSINIEQSPHKQRYLAMLNKIEMQKNIPPFMLSTQAVIKKIIHALESPHPKIHYYVTFPAYLLRTLKWLLPSRVLDKLLVQINRKETM